ncbi:hypothetical protein E4U56_002043 [Claviceps arundinis]|uniref:Uncharacterized protein n=1 Tax=Claviceps arundinis TaxID=1623583 RepID=A0A9P7MQF1_9HYPO|nr:hypothetical protein E4U56_002043 [Claviceps arundinis]
MSSYKESQSLSLAQDLAPTQSSCPTPQPVAKLAAQHKRLVSELFIFNKRLDNFEEWLKVDFVQGAWAEFGRDCVTNSPS